MNKKILIILGISLAANFIFIGFETAKIIYQPSFSDIPPERPHFMRPEGQRPDAFDFQDKGLMRKAFKAALKNHGKQMEAARQEVEDTLKNDPFDPEKFKTALKKATEIRSTIDAAVQENMTEFLLKMTPEERRIFADKFSQKGQRQSLFYKKDQPNRFFQKRHREEPLGKNIPPKKRNIPFKDAGPEARMKDPIPCAQFHHKRPCGPAFRKEPMPPCAQFHHKRPDPALKKEPVSGLNIKGAEKKAEASDIAAHKKAKKDPSKKRDIKRPTEESPVEKPTPKKIHPEK